MDSFVLWIPCIIPGPVNSWIVFSSIFPSPDGVKMIDAFPGPGTAISTLSYTSPYACRPIIIGFFHVETEGLIFLTNIGFLNTVPSSIDRIVPLGLFHIFFRSYSLTRSAFGVIVAHFIPTPYSMIAFAESNVTRSSVISRFFMCRS